MFLVTFLYFFKLYTYLYKMRIENYTLTELTNDIEDLDSIARKEFISGVCSSLVDAYQDKYDLNQKQALWLVFDLTEIYCEEYLTNYRISKI